MGHDLWETAFRRGPKPRWTRRFRVDGEPVTVIGILPRSFRFPLEFQTLATAQLITPLRLDPANTTAGNHSYYGVARLQPGVTAEQATAELRGSHAAGQRRAAIPRACSSPPLPCRSRRK